MFKIFLNNFKTTNDCIIVATPLILFFTILGSYLAYAINVADDTTERVFAAITIFIMVSGFLSAWFYMIKKAIYLTKQVFLFDKERLNAIFRLFKEFLKGIGRLLIPIIWMLSTIIVAFVLFLGLLSFLIERGIFNTGYDIVIYFSLIISTFTTMYWIPEIVYSKKNAFVSLFESINKLFNNLKESFILYIFISFLMSVIFIVNFLLPNHPIMSFLSLLLFYYLLVYVVVLLFDYYDNKFER